MDPAAIDPICNPDLSTGCISIFRNQPGGLLLYKPAHGGALHCQDRSLLLLPVIVCLLFGQIDGLILLGLFMPRPLGLILLLAKPQMGAAIAVFWLVEAWRAGRWKQVATTIAPVTVLFLISLALYGLWPLQLDMKDMFVATFNTSLWPGSLMIGLPLLVHALRHRKESFALMAAPFFSPYVTPQSWSVALVGLMPYELEMVAASLASWALLIIKIAASH